MTMATTIPKCNWFGGPLTERLPSACVMRGNACDALLAIENEGYRKLGEKPTDTAGLEDLERYECCFRCWSDLARLPRIQRLRAKVQQRPQPRRTDDAHTRPAPPKQRPVRQTRMATFTREAPCASG